jgi:hypothetical protein
MMILLVMLLQQLDPARCIDQRHMYDAHEAWGRLLPLAASNVQAKLESSPSAKLAERSTYRHTNTQPTCGFLCCCMVQFVGLNLSSTFVNPSDTDDCPRYVEKSLSYLIQVNPVPTLSLVLTIGGSIRLADWLAGQPFCFICGSAQRPPCLA